jgi:DNA-binding transcriptional MerR regulator
MAFTQISFSFDETPAAEQNAGQKIATGKKTTAKPATKVAIENPATKNTKSTRGRMSIKDMEATANLIDVPADDILFQKMYYPMSVVAEMFKVNQSLLRFWENEFAILKPKKNGKGDRLFRPEDIKNLKLIHHLLRERKYTLEGAKDFLKNNKKSEERFAMIESLKKIKYFLTELKANL